MSERKEDKSICIAAVDLDANAVGTLRRLGWLDDSESVSQMVVNIACTQLVHLALEIGLRPSSA
jgi:hypothetical protein